MPMMSLSINSYKIYKSHHSKEIIHKIRNQVVSGKRKDNLKELRAQSQQVADMRLKKNSLRIRWER